MTSTDVPSCSCNWSYGNPDSVFEMICVSRNPFVLYLYSQRVCGEIRRMCGVFLERGGEGWEKVVIVSSYEAVDKMRHVFIAIALYGPVDLSETNG